MAKTADVAAVDLRPLGINFNGSIIDIMKNGITYPIGTSISGEEIQQVVRANESVRTFRTMEKIYEGNHGRVEAVLDNSSKILFRKVPTDGNTLECEALFQIAARNVLERFNMGAMIASVCDIYRDPRAGHAAVFTMEPFLNIELLSDALTARDFHIKDIVSIIAQIALALYILDNQLDMNHRDLKTTNILIESISTSNTLRQILFENIKCNKKCISIYGHHNVKLVDFGFACTGNRRRSFINAGNFFPISDPCPKTGRDIFQLLTTMFLCTRFQVLLESEAADADKLAKLFRHWLKIPNNDYIGFLKTIGGKSIEWVYLMLGSDKFYAPNCESLRVLQDISVTFSDIVTIV